jgi:hypothetical protein
MTINKAKTSSYDSVTPRWIVDYIQRYAADINATVNPDKADNSAITTRLSNCNKTQLKAIAAELETVQKRLAWILHNQY